MPYENSLVRLRERRSTRSAPTATILAWLSTTATVQQTRSPPGAPALTAWVSLPPGEHGAITRRSAKAELSAFVRLRRDVPRSARAPGDVGTGNFPNNCWAARRRTGA
jgi:hypothetical protein